MDVPKTVQTNLFMLSVPTTTYNGVDRFQRHGFNHADSRSSCTRNVAYSHSPMRIDQGPVTPWNMVTTLRVNSSYLSEPNPQLLF
jgi:hypothetical protein